MRFRFICGLCMTKMMRAEIWSETPIPWNELPIDKMPLDQARKFLETHRYFLRQIDISGGSNGRLELSAR